MGQLGALGEAGRARRVEDRDVVVGVDVGVGQPGRGAGGIDRRRPSATQSSGSSRSERTAITCSGASSRRPSSSGQHPLEALVVGDQHLGPGVGEAVLHLRRRPPGVHPDDGGADRRDRPVADDPLRVVAHGQRHPVAGADAVHVAEVVGERPHLGVDLGVRVALVLVHDVDRDRRTAPSSPRAPASFGGACSNTRIGMSRTVDLGHGEGGAGGRQLVPGDAQVIDHRTMMPAPAPDCHPDPRFQAARDQAPTTVGSTWTPPAATASARRRSASVSMSASAAVTAPTWSSIGSRLRAVSATYR